MGKRIDELVSTTTVDQTDLLLVEHDPSIEKLSLKILISDFRTSLFDSVLNADLTNDFIGIGTTSPASKLSITGITGQTSSTIDTTTNMGATVIVSDGGTAVGNGGMILFGAADMLWLHCAIKDLVVDGTNHTCGDLAFSTRRVNSDDTLTQAMIINQRGNLGIGSSITFDSSAISNMVMLNGTAPSAHTDNQIYLYAGDSSDSTSTLCLYLEQAVEAIGTFTASHKIKVGVNGTFYWIQLDAV